MPKSVAVKHSSRKDVKKDPKKSHLYTDDNPSTTLHGTGFKDAARAETTLQLVSNRSLTYQFQTINTMLYRAKGHPHKTAGMHDAITIFQTWIESYKTKKASLRNFKLVTKQTVEKYLKVAEEYNEDHEGSAMEQQLDLQFARVYVTLPAKTRLANTLVRDDRPGEEDWEIRRYRELCALVKDHYEEDELWQPQQQSESETRIMTTQHLRMVMWAYSPVTGL